MDRHIRQRAALQFERASTWRTLGAVLAGAVTLIVLPVSSPAAVTLGATVAGLVGMAILGKILLAVRR